MIVHSSPVEDKILLPIEYDPDTCLVRAMLRPSNRWSLAYLWTYADVVKFLPTDLVEWLPDN